MYANSFSIKSTDVYDCALKLARIYIKLLIVAASGKSGGDTKGEMLVFTFFVGMCL